MGKLEEMVRAVESVEEGIAIIAREIERQKARWRTLNEKTGETKSLD